MLNPRVYVYAYQSENLPKVSLYGLQQYSSALNYIHGRVEAEAFFCSRVQCFVY